MRILLAGEGWTVLRLHVKGFDVYHLGGFEDFGRWFKQALSKFPDVEVIHMPNYVAFREFPNDLNTLKKFDVVVLSDLGSNSLVLYPELFKVPMGPNRLKVIRDYVEQGGALVMAGGWYSFSGEFGIARYYGTPIEEALPVELFPWDDRVEAPEGVTPRIVKPDHEIFKGIPEEWPTFLGYNKLKLKKGAELLAEVNEDPFIAVWNFGQGKSMAFASDLAPHWGTAFVEWEYYGKFWYQALRWLSK